MMIAIYHRAKTSIGFWYRRDLNLLRPLCDDKKLYQLSLLKPIKQTKVNNCKFLIKFVDENDKKIKFRYKNDNSPKFIV